MSIALVRSRLLPLLLTAFVGALALPAVGQEVGKKIDKKDEKGRKYALIVGVRNYKKDELRPLKYADKDATALADGLKEAGYRRVVLMTYDAAAEDADLLPTARNIQEQLKSLLEDRQPDDTVLLAFFGHGAQMAGAGKGAKEDKDYYLCPMDAELAEKETLLPLTEVYREMGKCRAETKLVVLDACYARPGVGPVRLALKARPQDVEVPKGVLALFSCAPEQFSYESDKLKEGLFAHFLLEGLGGKGSPKGFAISLRALVDHLQDQVPDAAKEAAGPVARQVPLLRGKAGPVLLASAAITLRTREEKTVAKAGPGVLDAPKTINAELNNADARDTKRAMCFCKVHRFRMMAGRAYTIDMRSAAFDTYLRLEDETGRQLAEDDDGGGGNARLIFTPPMNGVYRVIATSCGGNLVGPYILEVR